MPDQSLQAALGEIHMGQLREMARRTFVRRNFNANVDGLLNRSRRPTIATQIQPQVQGEKDPCRMLDSGDRPAPTPSLPPNE